jgi:hypothetical protein
MARSLVCDPGHFNFVWGTAFSTAMASPDTLFLSVPCWSHVSISALGGHRTRASAQFGSNALECQRYRGQLSRFVPAISTLKSVVAMAGRIEVVLLRVWHAGRVRPPQIRVAATSLEAGHLTA